MENYKYKRYLRPDQETRWATPSEIRQSGTYIDLRERTYPAAGLPLMSDGKEAWVDEKDTHTIIFGATGSKKTRLFCLPMLGMFIRAGESFVATDPKGELYRRTSGMAKAYGYETVVLNFRDIGKGDFWNPIHLPYQMYHSGDEEGAVSRLNDFVQILSEPQRQRTNDVFWPEMASSYALANLMLLMECGDPSEANVISLSRLCDSSQEKDIQKISGEMSPYTIAGMNYKGVLTAPERTKQSIYATLYGMLRIFNTQRNVSAVLSGNTIEMKSIGRKKTALYIIVPDEKTTLHFLVTTFVKQVYEILIGEAQKEENGMLPVRVNFVLDEFCNLPRIPDMPAMISAARSRNMRFFLVAQSLHQLIGRYGEDADTIMGNCDNLVFLTSRELDLLEKISQLCGNTRDHDGSVHRLISVSQLQRLDKEKGEALILHGRQYPVISEIADIDRYEAFRGYDPVPMKQLDRPDYRILDASQLVFDILTGKRPQPFVE